MYGLIKWTALIGGIHQVATLPVGLLFLKKKIEQTTEDGSHKTKTY